MSNNSLLLGIVLLVALSVLGGYYIGTSKTNINTSSQQTAQSEVGPTADWMTYADTDYKFSVKYPQDWKISDSTTTGTIVTFETSNTDEPKPSEGPPFIGILPVDERVSVQQQIGSYSSSDYKIVSVNGQELVLFLYTYQLGTSGIANEAQSKEVLNQMASTMKSSQ